MIHAKCSSCKAFLRYKLTDQGGTNIYKLIKYDAKHNHPTANDNSTKKEKVVQFLKSLDTGVPLVSMKKYVMHEFNVSHFTFYAALREM